MDGLTRPASQRFTREDRLRKRAQFDAAYKRGTRISCRHFALILLPNEAGRSRLGMTLSRKVGNAVERNRARRRLREIFRRRRQAMPGAIDLIVHARPGIADVPLAELESELLSGLAKFEKMGKGGPGR